MSTLIENVSSDYFGAYANLLPKSQPIVVYVESEADIAFWRIILQSYEKHLESDLRSSYHQITHCTEKSVFFRKYREKYKKA